MLKRVITVLPFIMLICGLCVPTTYCTDEKEAVTFSGESNVIEFSSDNLFMAFNDYLPGDSITQTITLNNNYDKKTGIYLTMLVADQEEDSELIWSLIYDKLSITVTNSKGEILYNGAFGGTWVQSHTQGTITEKIIHLAELQPNSQEDIKVVLNVPHNLGNEYQNLKANVVWRFTAEYDDYTPPYIDTGDNDIFKAIIPVIVAGGIACTLIVCSAVHKKLNK